MMDNHNIATANKVYEACNVLSEEKNNWSRYDVRDYVGGGSIEIIDLLINSWRKIQPLKEKAPTTSDEFLVNIVKGIEEKYNKLSKEMNDSVNSHKIIFEETTAQYSTQLESIKTESQNKENKLISLTRNYQEIDSKFSQQSNELAEKNQKIDEISEENKKLKSQLTKLMEERTIARNNYKHEIEQLQQQQLQQAQVIYDKHQVALKSQKIKMSDLHCQTTQRLKKQVSYLVTEQVALEKNHRIDKQKLCEQQESLIQHLNSKHEKEINNQKEELDNQREDSEKRMMVMLDQEREENQSMSEMYQADNDKQQEENLSLQQLLTANNKKMDILQKQMNKHKNLFLDEQKQKNELMNELTQIKTELSSAEMGLQSLLSKEMILGELKESMHQLRADLAEAS
ncbi:MAG: hypothetical protein HON94_12930 [Methylococcales bacterium]|jgi:hypothetical protein|nr:hypothetical protein [Methylococcales bacterium]